MIGEEKLLYHMHKVAIWEAQTVFHTIKLLTLLNSLIKINPTEAVNTLKLYHLVMDII